MSSHIKRLRFTLLSSFAALMIVSTSAAPARANPWFENCESVAARSPAVRDFLEEEGRSLGPCFPLNARELLYFDETSGTNFQGLYYKKLGKDGGRAEQLTSMMGNIKEFVGANKKRYALINTGWMNHGMQSSAVVLLYPVPGSQRPFRIDRLLEDSDNEGCVAPQAQGSCAQAEYVRRLSDGDGANVTLSSGKPFAPLDGPKLIGGNDAVSALEFGVPAKDGRKAWAYRYTLSGKSLGFVSTDFGRVVDRMKVEAVAATAKKSRTDQ